MAKDRLTFREQQVLELLATGYSNQGIAAELSISLYSVKKHVSAIILKLYARNRTHAAAIAVHRGLIRPSAFEASIEPTTLGHMDAGEAARLWDALTSREMDIFTLLGEPQAIELTNEALAQDLNITRNTLRKHLRNIYKKLNIRSRAGLVGLSLQAKREMELEKPVNQEL